MEGSELANSTIIQSGTNGPAFVEQGGTGNTSIVNQTSGDANQASVYQTATDGAYSSVTQTGNANVATVHQ